eukprot:403362442
MLFPRKSVTQLLQQFRSNQTTPVKVMEEVIQRSLETKKFNHFIHQDHKAMLENAQKASNAYKNGNNRVLEGVPIGLKDNIDTDCSPTTAGCPALLGHRPKFNCTLWNSLKTFGMINAGKMNLHELSWGTMSNNAHFGAARSAFDFDRAAGGSSGGSGGVVGTGTLPIALGTDTGGSIRIPASFNGVIGYKPTISRWPADYGVKMTHFRDQIGCLAVNMDDVALMDEQIVGELMHKPHQLPKPQDIRIGIPNSHYYQDLDPLVQDVAERSIKRLRDAGFQLITNDGIPDLGEINKAGSFDALEYENIPRLLDYLNQHGLKMTVEEFVSKIGSPDVKGIMKGILNNPVSEEKFYQSFHVSKAILRREMNAYYERNSLDVVMYPSIAILPVKLEGYKGPDYLIPHNGKMIPQLPISIKNTDPASNCNNPALSIPARQPEEGLPVNMEFMCQTGQDKKLISIGRVVENFIK